MMDSILTVTTVADSTNLTILETLKDELGISQDSTESDARLNRLIAEASAAVTTYCRRVLAQEGVSEVFRLEYPSEYLMLRRIPVSEIDTVTVDDVAVDADEYEVDSPTGILYRLDSSGYRCHWYSCKKIVVAYTGGYELLDSLPYELERATLALCKQYWFTVNRDPLVKSEDIPGLGSFEYWVGSVGANGSLPPDVIDLIAPFRRPSV
jgi:hypothetical protein